MNNSVNHSKLVQLLPVLFSFFVMGFVDIVGVSTSYVKQDFDLSDKLANLLPMLVFLWFAVFSLPTGILMGKVGRKKMVLISMVITFLAMLIPLFDYSFYLILIAFALLGIGNTVLQVSLNPLLADVVEENEVTGMLTLGQFIKAISSFLGPILASLAMSYFGNWKLIFPTYAFVSLLSLLWLQFTPIKDVKESGKDKNNYKVISLLKSKQLLVMFSIIVIIVGFEIGLMTALPKYLLERCGIPIEKGTWGCSLYYAARTLGTLIGSFVLMRIPSRKFILVTLMLAILFFALFMSVDSVWILMTCLFVIGLACSNVFAIVFSTALQTDSSKANEISALMITGVAGGALIPPIMGVIADATNQLSSLFVLFAALVYMLISAYYVIKK